MTNQQRITTVTPASDTALWHKLQTMQIEPPGAAITFAAKLARNNGWDRQLAEAVGQEYRRFLYLAATSTGPVSPSHAIDQAWHLHLTYSRHYWDVLCGQVLQRPLHHDPSRGGAAEDARHADQYARTLDLYRDTFGAEPPAAIWPQAAPRPRAKRVFALTGAAAAAGLLGAGAAAAASKAAPEDDDGWVIWFLIAFFAVALVIGLLRGAGRHHSRRDGSSHGDCGGSSCGSSNSDGNSGGDGGSSCGGGGCGGGGGD